MPIIRIKRGLNAANMPTLADGELAYSKESNELYIGYDGVNTNLSSGDVTTQQILDKLNEIEKELLATDPLIDYKSKATSIVVKNNTTSAITFSITGTTTAVTIPNTTLSIAAKGMETFYIGSSCTNINGLGLDFLALNISTTYFESGSLFTLTGSTKFNIPVSVPDGVSSCANLLDGCTSFNSDVTIPDSVTNISNMFKGCTSLTTIPNDIYQLMLNGTTKSHTGCFNGCTNITSPITYDNIPSDWK